MKYHLDTFTVKSEATKYPKSIAVLYYTANGFLILGDVYKNTIPMCLLKEHINIAKMLLGDNIEAVIKVSH